MNNVPLPFILLVFACIGLFLWWQITGGIKTPAPRTASPSMYSRADFDNHRELDPYADQLVIALNKIRKESHFCKQNMDPSSTVLNPPLSKQYHDTIFTVQCWSDEGHYNQTSFSLDGNMVSNRLLPEYQ